MKSSLIVALSLVLWSCNALVSHRLFRASIKHPRFQPLLHSDSSPQTLSPETNFWIARTQNNKCSSSNDIPAIPRLDHETGSLPPGAYRRSYLDNSREMIAPCLISIGIRPPLQSEAGEDVWKEGVSNCQMLIDSGFNTFRFNNCHHKRDKMYRGDRTRSPLSAACERLNQLAANTKRRHQAEAHFYQKLNQNTPSSVLHSCHFMVNLEMPLSLTGIALLPGMENEITRAPYGNGLMLKQSVSSALLRTERECLDSVVFEYSGNSPYHIDALDTLFELKREGLIQSISTKNFPPSLLLESTRCGFEVHSNDVVGNIMNTNNLQHDSQSVVSRLVSAPLGGGIFTNQFSQFQEWSHLSPERKNNFNDLLDVCCPSSEKDNLLKWKTYRTIIDSLVELSNKYQVSVESIVLRWLLQLNNGDSVCVGTLLGMNLNEYQGGRPYNRHRDFREVFTFSLEENDMEELLALSDFSSRQLRSRTSASPGVEFTGRRLFV